MVGSWLLFVMFNYVFVTFPCGILGQVWYLIVSIPDLCRLSYTLMYIYFVGLALTDFLVCLIHLIITVDNYILGKNKCITCHNCNLLLFC